MKNIIAIGLTTLFASCWPQQAQEPPGRGGAGRGVAAVVHTLAVGPDLGFTYDSNPLPLPAGMEFASSVAGVAINSKGHIFVYQRAAAGIPMLLEFDQNQKFVRGFGEGIAARPHSMRIDAQDNVWITDVIGNTVMKLNPQGQIVMTLGTKGKSGEWNEAAGTKYLNQPTDVTFGDNGEFFISEGHGTVEPWVLRFDRDGKLITRWSGKVDGPGAFSMIHTIARDAKGNIYLGDREVKRLVIYDSDGKFIKTVQMSNLLCGFYVTKDNEFYMTSGQDGQIEKLDWDGKVLGVAGKGPGKGTGEFGEAHYMAIDRKGDIYVADTENGRVAKLIKQK
jgi:DNA-binding beta-propeller fold protein YncE